MTSNSSRSGESPLWPSALTTLATRPSASTWTAERLTASLTCSGHFAASAQAVRSTQSPMWRMRPASSAIGMKTARQDLAAGRVLPAHQRLEGDDLAELGIDDRLVGDRELVLEQGGAQIGLDHAALLGLGEHPRLEEGEALAALVLRHGRARGRRCG